MHWFEFHMEYYGFIIVINVLFLVQIGKNSEIQLAMVHCSSVNLIVAYNIAL